MSRKPKEQQLEEQQVADSMPELTPVNPKDCSLLQHAHQTHVAAIPTGVPIEYLEDTAMWPNVAGKFRNFDRVEIEAMDGSMFARGIVTAVSGTRAKVRITEYHKLATVNAPEIRMNGYIIRNGGFSRKWMLVDEETGHVLKEGLDSQSQAIQHLQDHIKSMNA